MNLLDKELEELDERGQYFDSLNPRMFDKKDFLNMKIDHFKSLSKACLALRSKPYFKFLKSLEENI